MASCLISWSLLCRRLSTQKLKLCVRLGCKHVYWSCHKCWQLQIEYHIIDKNGLYLRHPFNGPFSRITQVGRYQKGKTNLDFTKARDSEWQWHQLGYVQVCILLQADNHASTPQLSFYRPDALPVAQPTGQSTEGNLWNMRQSHIRIKLDTSNYSILLLVIAGSSWMFT